MPSTTTCSNCKLCRLNQLYILAHDNKTWNRSIPPPSSIPPQETMSHPGPSPHSTTTLRLLTALPLPFSLAFILPYAILTGNALILIALIPLSISVALAFFHHRHRTSYLSSEKTKHTACSSLLATLTELFLPALYLICLVPIWIQLGSEWRRSTMVVVGTYGTVGMVFNLSAHIYLLLRSITWPSFDFSSLMLCPSCRTAARNQDAQRRTPMGQRAGGVYRALGQVERGVGDGAGYEEEVEEGSPGVEFDDARSEVDEDVDDERARLV